MDLSKEQMLIAEARVETERSSRYLVHLCKHFEHKAPERPDVDLHVEWSDDHGRVSFGWGRCTLDADPRLLTLRAEAPDAESLQRVEDVVATLLETFGKRDGLTVTWMPTHAAGDQAARTTAKHHRGGQAHG